MHSASTPTHRLDIRLHCANGDAIAATLYHPQQPLKGAVLIGPATGIKRQFYGAFCDYLSEKGFGVLSFDNRGIGESLSGHVKDCDVTLQSWGEQDLPAALEALKAQFPETTYHLVGHSAGGQLVGLMPNAKSFKSIFNVACSSGQLRNMRLGYQLKAHFFMNGVIPASNALFGHTKSQWFGMGEPLPKHVARQWKEWCNGIGYVKTAFGHTVFDHWYDDLTTPSMWVHAIDDDIANHANVADMISVYPNMPATRLTLFPDDHGLKDIGHMKFFSRKSKILWRYATDWLTQHAD